MYVNSKLMISAELINNALSILTSHQKHIKFIDVNESKEINKVTIQRNEINTLLINHEMTIDNSISCISIKIDKKFKFHKAELNKFYSYSEAVSSH